MEQLNPGSIGLAACGILCCFFGYRTTRLLLDASGFVVLGLIGVLGAGFASGGHLLFMLGGLAAGGLLGLLVAHFIYRLGLMLFGGGLGALVAWSYADTFLEGNAAIAAIVIAGVASGLAALFLERFTLSLVTAALGAWFTVRGVFLILEAMEITPVRPETGASLAHISTMVLAWAALTGVGFLFQVVAGGRKKSSGQ